MEFSTFQHSTQKMIATNDNANYNDYVRNQVTRLKDYTPEEIERIINSGSLIEQQKLSRNYFYKNGFYRRIIIHYATLLKYSGLLIPNPSFGKNLSTDKSLQKKYYSAVDFVERIKLPTVLTNFSYRALVDGSYYGVIVELTKNNFQILDLPARYCCSRYKDIQGNDVIEFDVSYFNTILDLDARTEALNVYPKVIRQAYRNYQSGKRKSSWVVVPSDIGICFPFFDGRPLFLNVIPATIDYDEALEAEKERELEEIRKIIVQKIPHLTDGGLLFEPEEAAMMHEGAVGMMKHNKNISVLTTYADVDAIVSRTSNESNTTLATMMKNLYDTSGTSSEVFDATGSSSLATSLRNDLALMMVLGNKYANFITNIVNYLYGNSNITFKYNLLPITYYNETDMISNSFKLANQGYSLLIPAIALGLSQRDLVNIRMLEQDVLKLNELIVPISTASAAAIDTETTANNTDSSDGEASVGRPKLAEEEKSEKTLANEASIENTGNGGAE